MSLQTTSSEYNINSIETLSFRDAVRTRIQMYLGSNDNEGAIHGLQEIISNSIDEFIMGYGNEIIITLHGDNVVSVRDFGRGVPFGKKEDGTNTLQAIYSSAHTGGKFNDKAYQFAVGLNGIGAKATCLSAESFSVVSSRDGKLASAVFEKGNMVDYQEVENTNGIARGTYVKFKPDAEVFNLEPINISFERVCDICKNLSYLTKGLKFTVELAAVNDNPGETKVFMCEDGLVDLIKDTVKSPVHNTVINYTLSDDTNTIEIALQWAKGREKSYCFTNGVLNAEGGTPITGIKTSITRTLNKYFKGNLTGELARTGLVYAVSCKVANPSFANQTKTKINNPELRSLADKAFAEAFTKFKDLYPNECKKIEDFLLKEKKAEEAAEKARNAVLNAQKQLTAESKKKTVAANKLADCKYHDERSSLYICEGDSACGSIKLARNSDFVAAMPIRGKIINALKNPLDEVLENEEVQAINKVLGCGMLDHINTAKTRYGKIFFAADADPDGNSIVCLLLVLFYKMWPELIKEGRVYWAQFPLYEVTVGKTKYFAYDDEELKKLPKGKVSRNKGLGEMDPDDFERAAFSDEARAIRFTMEDVEEAKEILETLLGNENEARSQYIFENVDFTTVEGE